MNANEGSHLKQSASHLLEADSFCFVSIHCPFPVITACLDLISDVFMETLRIGEKSVFPELCWLEDSLYGSQKMILVNLSNRTRFSKNMALRKMSPDVHSH
jgi:hypothetical protein